MITQHFSLLDFPIKNLYVYKKSLMANQLSVLFKSNKTVISKLAGNKFFLQNLEKND